MKILNRFFLTSVLLVAVLALAACDGVIDSDDSDDIDTTEAPAAADDADADDMVTVDDADADDTAMEDDVVADETPTADDATADDDAVTDDDATTDEDLDVQEVLDRASERVNEIETAQFELDGTGTIEIDEVGEVSLSNAKGALQRPDRAMVELDVDVVGMSVPLKLISIDGETYFTDVMTGSWYSVPDDFRFNPSVIFDDDEGIPALIRNIEGAEITGSDEVGGRDAYRIRGIIDRDKIIAGTSGMFEPEDDVDFEIWVDKETFDVLWLRADDPTDETDLVWDMRIHDHNEPVDIPDPREDDDS